MPVFGAAGLLLYLTAVFCTDGALFGIIPTPDSLQLLRSGIDEGFQNINDFATPVPTTTGLVLLTAGALGLTTIVVDVVAVSLRRPAASGLALLALYAVPVAVVLGGVPWVLFAIAACGYLMLLLVEGRDRLAHWGRPVGATARSASAAAGPIQVPPDEAPAPLTGQRIGAVAIALAVILPLMVPGMTGNTLNKLGQTGAGDGTGNGNGPLNEFATLRGQLRQGQQVTLMTVNTSLPQPQYLRTKVLDRYQDNSGWAASNVSARSPVGGNASLPPPDAGGLSTGSQSIYTTEVQLTGDYNDNYLPVYYAPSRVENVGDDWRYDSGKSVIVADRRRGDFSYTVSGNEPTPTVQELEASPPLTDDQRNELPTRLTIQPDLPAPVIDTANQIIRGHELAVPAGQGDQRLLHRRHARLHLRRDHDRREHRRQAGRLPAEQAGLLRAVRGGDGRDAPGRAHPVPGRDRLHAGRPGQRRPVDGHQPRRARLGRGLLRQRRLDLLRPDAAGRRADGRPGIRAAAAGVERGVVRSRRRRPTRPRARRRTRSRRRTSTPARPAAGSRAPA